VSLILRTRELANTDIYPDLFESDLKSWILNLVYEYKDLDSKPDQSFQEINKTIGMHAYPFE
jgi:hypothetical protein